MPDKVTVDVATGARTTTALEGAELDAFNAALAAEPARAAALDQAVGNRSTLLQRAANALAANGAYLAIPSPTNVQVVAQVALLTRECSALIRLLLNAIDDIAGT